MPIHSKEKLEKFKKTCEDVVRGESCTFSTCEDCPFYRNNNGYGVSCSEIIGMGYSSASPYAKKFLEGKIVFYEGGLVEVEDEEGETTTTKKYEFTGETTTHYGRTLHRIRRLKDGLIGGW